MSHDANDDCSRVERFFTEALPALIIAQPAAWRGTRGVLSVIVEGAGSWTLTFGAAPSQAVVDEGDPDADCVAVWTVPAFAALLAGATDLAAVRPAAVIGDEKLLARLGALLIPARKGAVSARLAALAA